MWNEVHVLSPLVPSREYFFLCYCQQVEAGEWLIVDVSLDSFGNCASRSVAKKFPSGCRIRELPNGCCMVFIGQQRKQQKYCTKYFLTIFIT